MSRMGEVLRISNSRVSK